MTENTSAILSNAAIADVDTRRRSIAWLASVFVGVQILAFVAAASAETHESRTAPAEGAEQGARAGSEARPDGDPRAEAEAEAPEAWTPALYVPPSRGQARVTAAGGTRGSARLGSLELAVLAPRDHVAHTTRAQPKLYWYVSESVGARIDVTLVDDDEIDPLLELTVPGPVGPGIQELDLASHGVRLEPGRQYSWHVALVRDERRRSNDLLAEGFIERREATEGAPDGGGRAIAVLARSGLWYDAIERLRAEIDARPTDARLLEQQTALLRQVELEGVAKRVR